MNDWIGDYKCITPMQTAGSGSARWCMVSRGFERFFLKEFLTPVYPVRDTSELQHKQKERCEQFEERKLHLYRALSCVLGDTLVPVVDFFRFERRYYAVSEAIDQMHFTAEKVCELPDEEKRRLLFDLALCLQRLHTQGVIHADLKPEHVLVLPGTEEYRIKLIDLDSGLLSDPAFSAQQEIEGDPVYLAPEVFLKMVGEETELTTKLDTFAFGALIHVMWTGELPSFDQERCQYLYEAVLEGETITLSEKLPEEYRATVQQMLSVKPEDRPDDADVTALFDAKPVVSAPKRRKSLNGLSYLMHK